MPDLIDLADLLPSSMQADARKRLKLPDPKNIAKRLKTKPFPRSIYPFPTRPFEQVIFTEFFTCCCGNSWHAPRYNGTIFTHIVNNPTTSEYIQADRRWDLPHRVEIQNTSVAACPGPCSITSICPRFPMPR